jgi:hypothetical protein
MNPLRDFMGKNFIGREDNSFDGAILAKSEVPSVEGAVKALTGVTLPFVDMSRGGGSLLNNAAVLGEGALRRLQKPALPEAENALVVTPEPTADRIRSLRDEYLRSKNGWSGHGKPFHPRME